MRYLFGILMLLTLVLRTSAGTPGECSRFVLESLDHREQWTVDACDSEAEAIREADGREFIIIDESILYGAVAVQSTTGALLLDHPARAERCWEFTLQPLEGGGTWKVTACETDADDIRAKDGIEYIIADEFAL